MTSWVLCRQALAHLKRLKEYFSGTQITKPYFLFLALWTQPSACGSICSDGLTASISPYRQKCSIPPLGDMLVKKRL
jgi:hypothetical protein